MNTLIRLSVIAVAVAGCGLLSGGSAPGVAGRTFLSTGVSVAGAPKPLVAGTQIRLNFTKDGSIGAQVGCNQFGGTYRLDGAVLRIDGGGMTEMGCDPDRMAQDDWLFALLGSAPTISLAGNELIMRSGDTVITLLDREIAEPDLALVGPTWTVVSIVSGDAVSSIPDGIVATLAFGADGQVAVQSGCNGGGGPYTVEGNAIRFGEIQTTLIGCDGAAAQMEAAVMQLLNADAVTFQIDASTLSLRIPGGGLDLQGG